MVKVLGEIPLRVQLHPRFALYRDAARSEYLEFHEYLLEYVGGLITELGIPFLLSLVIEVTDGEASSAETPIRPYQVQVNGIKCPYPPCPFMEENVTAYDLAVSISHVVYENRELLVTSDVSQKIFAQWREADEAGVISDWTAPDFYTLLIEAVRKGISLLWVESATLAGDFDEIDAGGPLKPEILFEKVIFTMDVTNLVVLLPEDRYQDFVTETSQEDRVNDAMKFILTIIPEGTFLESGIILPQVKVSVDTTLDPGWIRVQINNLRFPPKQCILPNQLLVNDAGDHFSLLRIPSTPMSNPLTQKECSVILDTPEFRMVCKNADLRIWNEEDCVGLLMNAYVRANYPLFLPVEVVEFLLWQLNKHYSHLVETFFEYFTITQLTLILRELLAEQVSIHNLWQILETLLELRLMQRDHGNLSLSILDWTELLRQKLRGQITSRMATSEMDLVALLLEPDWEPKIQEFDPMPDPLRDALVVGIQGQLGPDPSYPLPVLLTSEKIRRKVARAIQRDFPLMRVLSYAEIWEDWTPFPVGRIAYPPTAKDTIIPTE